MVYGYKAFSKFCSLTMAKQLYEVLLRVHGGTGRLAKGELALRTYCAPLKKQTNPAGRVAL